VLTFYLTLLNQPLNNDYICNKIYIKLRTCKLKRKGKLQLLSIFASKNTKDGSGLFVCFFFFRFQNVTLTASFALLCFALLCFALLCFALLCLALPCLTLA